jgi:ribonuclease G
VIDFIDMARARNRDAVMKVLRETLDEDRTKTFTAEISKLGLVEMTRQNVTEGVREIMTDLCPTCDGEGVIRSEETIAIEFERRLRDVAADHPDTAAFLVQINPRVTAEFTRQGSRTLHALEEETGRSFLFEGSEGLDLDHFAVTFEGTREEVEERALPFRPGDEVLVEIVEPHMYDVDDAVAKIDGYIISIAGAAAHVGEKRMVRIEQVGRTAAGASLLDESGEVIAARGAVRAGSGELDGASRERRSGAERRRVPRKGARDRGRRAPADSEDAEARREAGLSASPTAVGSEPEQETSEDVREAPNGTAAADEFVAEDVRKRQKASGKRSAPAASDADAEQPAEPASDDDVQSKPRRRGRRGGRRRSAARAKATPK